MANKNLIDLDAMSKKQLDMLIKKAKKIIDLRDDWQPECSLNTLTDGIFGTVKEGKAKDNVVFIWLSGYLDEDTGYSIEDIVDYLQYQLNITELEKYITKPMIIRDNKIY